MDKNGLYHKFVKHQVHITLRSHRFYNPVLVYCRELALGTVSLTGDRAKGDDSKHDSHYTKANVVQ